MQIPFIHSYQDLPEQFYSRVSPTPVAAPEVLLFNHRLADELQIPQEFRTAAVFSGNSPLPGSAPLSQVYAGHQYAHFVPQLGDGRAILLGELRDREGTLRDVQLKGAGRTPYSRRGDGRSALGPVIREYLLSEAMHALGIPSSRALAAISSGELVQRESAVPGGIFTRVASSHIRIGTFQYFSARNEYDAVKRLADYSIERHYPTCKTQENPYVAFLKAVVEGQAALVAQWLAVGFIHGVMNTDNCSVACETIDFGPCAFMDYFDPWQVYSYIDRHGRYAYTNQPEITQWNLARFAETLLPLLAESQEAGIECATEIVTDFQAQFHDAWRVSMAAKIGITAVEHEDLLLVQDFLKLLQETKQDFTLGFYLLSEVLDPQLNSGLKTEIDFSFFSEWIERWKQRLAREPGTLSTVAEAMRRVNPVVIPRNHQVERVITAAVEGDSIAEAQELLEIITTPYQIPHSRSFCLPPRPDQIVKNTFCGT